MKLNKLQTRSFFILFFLFITVLFATSFAYKVFDDGDDFELAKNLDIFHSVIRDIELYYVDDIDAGELISQAIEDMLIKLDPYTIYYPEYKLEDYRFLQTGTYAGIGAVILNRNNQLFVGEIFENMPAYEAGLKIGDVIIEIDGFQTKDIDFELMRSKLKGENGSSVELKIKREDEKSLLDFIIARKNIKFNDVPYFGMLKNNTGYIKLSGFNSGAALEVGKALMSLKKDGAKSLILDLRGNPGGLLIEAVGIVNLFVEKGNKIVSMRGKEAGSNKVFYAKALPIDTQIPIIVLVNNMSASASEIVSGALQDLDRAVIVGRRSFGKGLVQNVKDLSYNTKIKITTAKYYIPSGRCIQALDYSHRNPDGSVGNVSDSLKTLFKTSAGREVYDGGGIAPDIVVINEQKDKLIKKLDKEFVIFDFITNYMKKNNISEKPENLTVGETGYNDFINFIKKGEVNYKSDLESQLEKMERTIKKEDVNSKTLNLISELKQQAEKEKWNELNKYKKYIIATIDNRVSKRLFFEKGFILNSFNNDKIFLEASKILNDTKHYNEILSKKE